MSQENVEVIRRVIDAWSRGDTDAALADFSADGVVDLSRAVGPNTGIYFTQNAREMWDDFAQVWDALGTGPPAGHATSKPRSS